MDSLDSPFTDADTIDIVGVRKGGGLNLVLSVSGPIDDSPYTLKALETKIGNYIAGAKSERFLRHYGQELEAPIVIYISCDYPISNAAHTVIREMQRVAQAKRVGLELRRHMGDDS